MSGLVQDDPKKHLPSIGANVDRLHMIADKLKKRAIESFGHDFDEYFTFNIGSVKCKSEKKITLRKTDMTEVRPIILHANRCPIFFKFAKEKKSVSILKKVNDFSTKQRKAVRNTKRKNIEKEKIPELENTKKMRSSFSSWLRSKDVVEHNVESFTVSASVDCTHTLLYIQISDAKCGDNLMRISQDITYEKNNPLSQSLEDTIPQLSAQKIADTLKNTNGLDIDDMCSAHSTKLVKYFNAEKN